MIILDGGKKVERWVDWQLRLDIELANQSKGSVLRKDSPLEWAIKLLYFSPDNVQDYVWDKIGPTGFETAEIVQEGVMLKHIREALLAKV